MAEEEERNMVGDIHERLTRIGPGRSQGWTLFLDADAIAYYERDPLLFTQRFHVAVSPEGHEKGFHSVDTEEPFHEMRRQMLAIETVHA